MTAPKREQVHNRKAVDLGVESLATARCPRCRSKLEVTTDGMGKSVEECTDLWCHFWRPLPTRRPKEDT